MCVCVANSTALGGSEFLLATVDNFKRLTSSEHFFMSTIESAASMRSRYLSLQVTETKLMLTFT